MKATVGFFDESQGVRSSMRLMCFISLAIAAAIAFFAIGTKQLDVNVIAVIVLFVVAAFAPKAIQKYAESDVVSKLSTTTKTVESKTETS
jgi:c-di-AMP phosphodiesterase-like protein